MTTIQIQVPGGITITITTPAEQATTPAAGEAPTERKEPASAEVRPSPRPRLVPHGFAEVDLEARRAAMLEENRRLLGASAEDERGLLGDGAEEEVEDEVQVEDEVEDEVEEDEVEEDRPRGRGRQVGVRGPEVAELLQEAAAASAAAPLTGRQRQAALQRALAARLRTAAADPEEAPASGRMTPPYRTPRK